MPSKKTAKAVAKTRSVTNADKEVGLRIRSIRIDAGMSQDELGTRLGVSFQQIQKYEKGTNRLSVGRLAMVAKELGTTPHEIMGWESDGKLLDTAFDLEAYKLAKIFANLPSVVKPAFRSLINAVIVSFE